MEHLWQPRAIVFVLSDGESQRFHLQQGCLVSLVYSRYGEKGMSEVALGEPMWCCSDRSRVFGLGE
eukprot:6213735-Pleurochrysis_carterae.AAC.1